MVTPRLRRSSDSKGPAVAVAAVPLLTGDYKTDISHTLRQTLLLSWHRSPVSCRSRSQNTLDICIVRHEQAVPVLQRILQKFDRFSGAIQTIGKIQWFYWKYDFGWTIIISQFLPKSFDTAICSNQILVLWFLNVWK